MTEYNLDIARPWLLLIIVPALILGIIPFFKLHKRRRRAAKHIIPFIIHMILIVLLTSLVSGIRIEEVTTAPTNTTVIFVADMSQSNNAMKDDMNRFMKEIINGAETKDGETQFGLVMFANDVFEDSVKKPGELDLKANDYLQYSAAEEISESNIYKALKYAQSMFTDERQNKRIVLLSDGRETDGEARTAINGILTDGIKLDCAHFDLVDSGEAEIQIVSISTNNKVAAGGEVIINVQVKSTDNVRGTLTIYDGEFSEEQKITLVKGENKFQFQYIPQETGIHTVYAEIDVGSDTIEQNNQLSSWYKVEGIYNLLLIDGDEKQTLQMGNVLLDIEQDYEYEIRKSQDFPLTMEELLAFDEVVLMNVDFSKLPEGSDALIKRYVQENGRGLVVTCGTNSYDYSNDTYRDSPIRDILPVDLKIEDEKEAVAIAIIVDLSSSMRHRMGSNGQTRYDAALEATKKALDGLDYTKDYAGVIIFDQASHVALPMMPLKSEENVADMKETIEYELNHYYYLYYLNEDGTESDIRVNPSDGNTYVSEGYIDPRQVEGLITGSLTNDNEGSKEYGHDGDFIKAYGTSYNWPIKEASNMFASAMQSARLDVKQIVFISDGRPNDENSGFKNSVELMTKSGIVTSTVGVGLDPKNTGDSETVDAIRILKEMATKGRGELVLIQDPTLLPDKLYEIAQSIKGDYLNDRDVKPIMNETSDILRGVSDLDTLGGYYGTTIKDDAKLVLYVDNLKPIVAEWEVGLGKVTVFMSNFGHTWTSAMFDENDGIKNERLVKNILLASLNDQVGSTGIKINTTKRDDDKTTIRVELPTNVRQSEALKAVVKKVNGELVNETYFFKAANKKYRADINTPDKAGTYLIDIVLVDVKTGVEDILYDKTSLAVVGYYEDEYDLFKIDGKAILTDLVKVEDLKNKLITDADGFYDIEKKDIAQYYHDAEAPFSIAVLVLFMLAIFFRYFTFQKTKEKKTMSDEEQYASMRSSGR